MLEPVLLTICGDSATGWTNEESWFDPRQEREIFRFLFFVGGVKPSLTSQCYG